MSSRKIAVVVGSIRKDSFNKKLAKALAKLAPKDFSFNFLDIGILPHYNQDDDNSPAESVQKFKSEISAADGVLFVTPEYNRSIPGVLKNAIDHASRPYGKGVWAKKPAAVIGTSPGTLRTALAQQHLRNIIAYLDMPTLGQPEGFIQMNDGLFTEDGEIGEASRKFLQKWMDEFCSWVEKHSG